MKNLIYALIIGCVFMIISQSIEIMSVNQTIPGTTLNIIAFIFFAVGGWSLHRMQSQNEKNALSFVGIVLITIATFSISVVCFQVIKSLQSGDNFDFTTSPFFMFGGITITLGVILFGISIIRSKVFPSWTGVAIMLLPVTAVLTEAIFKTTFIREMLNPILAVIFLYLSFIMMKKLQPSLSNS